MTVKNLHVYIHVQTLNINNKTIVHIDPPPKLFSEN